MKVSKVLSAPCLALDELEKLRRAIDICYSRLKVCSVEEIPVIQKDIEDLICAYKFTEDYFMCLNVEVDFIYTYDIVKKSRF